MVREPDWTRAVPMMSSPILPRAGIASSAASNVARNETVRIRASRSRAAITARRSASRASAPKAFTTITPSKLSCTAAESIPSCAWAAR
uniref:Unannotated protein n=1 Tax=freshwater metagenome TaxID=449393 RepID=A0A6J7PLJ7_9ZZZZ